MGWLELFDKFLDGKGEMTIRIQGNPNGLKVEVSLDHPSGKDKLKSTVAKSEDLVSRMEQLKTGLKGLPEVEDQLKTQLEIQPEIEKHREEMENKGEIAENGHRNITMLSSEKGLWGLEKLGMVSGRKKKSSSVMARNTIENESVKSVEVQDIREKGSDKLLMEIKNGLKEIRSWLETTEDGGE